MNSVWEKAVIYHFKNKDYNMIPKIVHYCWFGRGDMPPVVKWCMKSWKKYLPDYTFKLWNEDNFDVNSVEFVREAYLKKKYAFVADYVRLYALYNEGGVYLDSDEKVLRPLDEFLTYDFVAAHEFHPGIFKPYRDKLTADGIVIDSNQKIHGLGILAAPLFSKPKHPFIKDCLDFYYKHHFLDSNGNAQHYNLVIGWIMSKQAEKYGYKYTTKELPSQNGFKIFDIHTFVNNALFLNKQTYTIHLSLGSWHDGKHSLILRLSHKYPILGYYLMTSKCFLRRIKHLFLTQEQIREIYGDWFT